MKVAAFIPARLDSQRFPRKLLRDLNGKPVIYRTCEAVLQTGLFDTVALVTDAVEIARAVEPLPVRVFISRRHHPTGTDRIAEFAGETDAAIIVNIQGDEPFVQAEPLQMIIEMFEADKSRQIDIVSLMTPLDSEEAFRNPNNVKVVTDKDGFALYFSRAPVPYPRDGKFKGAMKHIGIYAFRREALEKIARLPQTVLEQTEKLENLRFLENGFRIKMLVTDKLNIGIDTPEDLETARKIWKNG